MNFVLVAVRVVLQLRILCWGVLQNWIEAVATVASIFPELERRCFLHISLCLFKYSFFDRAPQMLIWLGQDIISC